MNNTKAMSYQKTKSNMLGTRGGSSVLPNTPLFCDMYHIFMAGLLTVTLRLLQHVRLPRMVCFLCLDLPAETSGCGMHCTDMARH